jgi:hypothetical protein
LAFACGCTPDISTERNTPSRPSLGEELYGVFCDRLGAQSLHEDLSGTSYHLLCHRKDGAFADKVDSRFLPSIQGGLSQSGQTVSAEQQQQARVHGIARIEALARWRADLISALDAMLPDIPVPAKDLKNHDLAQSCSPAGQERFRDQLSDLLNRLQADKLYIDGTLPNSTESLGQVFTAFKTDSDLQSALARIEARKGYHPPDVSLGALQPVLAYPGLRDLSNSSLNLISPDSKPYDLHPPIDASGQRIPVPGAAYTELTKLVEVGHHELRTATADPPVPPLAINRDPSLNREVLNRPRSTAETLQKLLLVEDPQLGGGDPRYIVRRDQRGVASVALVNGSVPSPFVDQDGDKLADIDDLGQFITSNGVPAPTPFPTTGEQSATSRDGFGRATATGGRLAYDYINTNHTFAAALLEDLKPLVNPDPSQQHETLMDSLAGLLPLFGSRQQAVKHYPADSREVAADVNYTRFNPNDSAVLDLAYAAGQMLGDPSIDDTLALTIKLFTEHPTDMARLVGAALEAKKIADRHSEATLSSRSTFWDELIQIGIEIARAPAVPGRPPLLEDLLIALASDDARPFKDVLAMQLSHKDLISYDRSDINGPALSYPPGSSGGVDVEHPNGPFTMWYTPVDRTQPDTGTNRSFFQRYLQLIHDSNDVSACNAERGRLFLHNICDPTFGCVDLTYQLGGTGAPECLIYRIKNLAKFYLDSIVGAAQLFLRADLGVRQFQSPQMFSDSTGLNGFWPTPRRESLRPRPEFLNRLVFFDFSDSPLPPGINYRTNCFISALNGPFRRGDDGTPQPPDVDLNQRCVQEQPPELIPPDEFRGSTGTSLCAEREIPDPCTTSSDCNHCATPEGRDDPGCEPDHMIHKLRTCANGQWLAQRDNNVLFAFEQPLDFPDGTRSSAYRALTPVVSVFVSHQQEELFLSLIEVLYRHWQDDRGTADECISPDPASPHYCSKDGLVRSEPMLAEIFGETDLMDALNNLNKVLINTTIQHCNAVDPVTQLCTSFTPMNGITVMANATRALLDPDHNVGLKDRRGNPTTAWNDGSHTDTPVTPLYLLTNALRSVDNVFDGVPDRKAQWLRARSQLVDQFLGVNGTGSTARFSRPGLPRVTITAAEAIRSQLLARCPGTFTPPYTARCEWARDEIFSNLLDTLSGPLFAALQDLTEKLRQDTAARTETEKLLTYLVGAPVNDPRRAALLVSLADVVQIASDQSNFIPILHALAPAVALSTVDSSGHGQEGLVDAELTLLTRASGKAFNASNVELCASEVDPNQVITEVLRRATTPVSINGKIPRTPLELYLDVITDVNRASPDQTDKLKPNDYASIFDQVADFMLSPDHGLEQFYEIVRQGTVR